MDKKIEDLKGKHEFNSLILNCIPSLSQEDDWTFDDAADADIVDPTKTAPQSKDLRTSWWHIDNQGSTGACVGYSTAYGVLRWHYVSRSFMDENTRPSARFIWMANKETDNLTSYPTTFLDSDGTQTKLALRVAQKYGCVPDDLLPMEGPLSSLSRTKFYAMASRFRISSYHNLGRKLDDWRHWLAFNGPILTRLGVDRTWDKATENKGKLNVYQPNTVRGGHAVCLVGYTENHFIVRNSWGTEWGDEGYAYASNEYTREAFTEAYGAVL
jgi:hypothetical protein